MANEHHDNKVTDSYSDAQVLDICQQHADVDLVVDETKSPPSLQELSNAIATNPLSPEQPQASLGDVEVTRTKKSSGSSTSNEDKKNKQGLKCRFCPMTFSKSQALGGHMNRHRQEREQEQLNHAKKLIMAQQSALQYGGWNTSDKGHINFNHAGYVMPLQPSMFSSPPMYHSSQPSMNMQNQPNVYVPQAILQGHHGINTHGSDDTRILQNSNMQGELLPTGAYGRQMNVASGSRVASQMQMHAQQSIFGPFDNLHNNDVMPNYGMEQYTTNLQLNKQSIFQSMEGSNQNPYIKVPMAGNIPPSQMQRCGALRNDLTHHFAPIDSLGQVVEHGQGRIDGRNVKPRTMHYQGSNEGNMVQSENFQLKLEQVDHDLGIPNQTILMKSIQELGENEQKEDNTIIGPGFKS